jgi:UDP-N-acetylglucosamine diphosphorylase / glucose-1-phosphate thymidylyltransferase / UDP-N-acetylgalactosamine diphosphorylase / glucosamine-1-phosphate N-acetyltransferase / galactosamine-1-phosphate N-acetyltransferase
MQNLILFDDQETWLNLNPLTLTKPISEIRCGGLTIKEKWEARGYAVSYLTQAYLAEKYTVKYEADNLYVNSALLLENTILECILSLESGKALFSEDVLLAYRTSEKLNVNFDATLAEKVLFQNEINILRALPDTFLLNAKQIASDYAVLVKNKKSKVLTDSHVAIYGHEIFIEETVSIKACILNAETGPIFIDKGAVIQEGSLIIGPAFIGKEAMVAFGAKIRPNTTLGPVCRVGGEVGNSIFHAYSNKAHDGFVGNSYIGEWCNLGANTNNSNLKNDYKEVKLYNYRSKSLENTGQLFCGTFMGDYTKTGISTMLNTGTVLGVSANVFGPGFQDKYVTSFSWGGLSEGYETYRFNKAVEVINATMARREKSLSVSDLGILEHIFRETHGIF